MHRAEKLLTPCLLTLQYLSQFLPRSMHELLQPENLQPITCKGTTFSADQRNEADLLLAEPGLGCMHGVFVAARGLSLLVASRAPLLVLCRLLAVVASLVARHGL